MQIRAALAEDLPELAGLLGYLFEQEPEMTVDSQAQLRGLEMILNQPEIGELFVADSGDAILGMVNLLYTVSTSLGARVAILEDVIVAPDGRGRGIGSQLIQEALRSAEVRGCKRVTLVTDPDNVRAQRLYESFGFERSAMVGFRKMLGRR
ncbi:MAG: GNAT family N-acetyltransferase [bacterium]|nr:GNAT family N-acetyltransferase [bacterium]